MAFAANSTLITSAERIDITANGTSGDTYQSAVEGRNAATAYVIADGDVGDDAIVGFSSNDTIITGKAIYDGNKDGYISFGDNGVLDVDRTSSKNAGNDQISVLGSGNDRVLTIRYLGSKDGGFAYGDAGVRDNLLGHFSSGSDNSHGTTTAGDSVVGGFAYKYDSQVTSENFDFGKGASVLLIDNATGLNFGSDFIKDFGSDDLLVTTSKLYDSNGSNIVTFGGNKVLDLSGSTGPSSSDPAGGPGGQVDTTDTSYQGKYEAVGFLGQQTIDGTTYYYYGSTSHAGGSHGSYTSTYSGPALHFDGL